MSKVKLPNANWRSHSDNEVIRECFAAFGIECIHFFNGMFAIALWDTHTEQLVEWTTNVPTKFKINGGQKYLPKKYLERSLSHESIYRKKWGFPAPTNKWFKGELKDQKSLLLKKDVVLNQNFIQKIWHEYLESGNDLHGNKIFALVQFVKWRENYGS